MELDFSQMALELSHHSYLLVTHLTTQEHCCHTSFHAYWYMNVMWSSRLFRVSLFLENASILMIWGCFSIVSNVIRSKYCCRRHTMHGNMVFSRDSIFPTPQQSGCLCVCSVQSEFRTSKMADGSHFVKNFQKRNFVIIWNGQKCDRKWFSDIQDGRQQPFCKQKITKIKIVVLIWNGKKCDTKWFWTSKMATFYTYTVLTYKHLFLSFLYCWLSLILVLCLILGFVFQNEFHLM